MTSTVQAAETNFEMSAARSKTIQVTSYSLRRESRLSEEMACHIYAKPRPSNRCDPYVNNVFVESARWKCFVCLDGYRKKMCAHHLQSISHYSRHTQVFH